MDASDKHLSTLSCEAAGTPLFFLRMQGFEGLGRLARYEIDFAAGADHVILPAKVLGQDMSLSIGETDDPIREINGIVTEFRVVGMPHGQDRKKHYHAVVQPRLWLLTRGAHSRFYYDKSVLDIARLVLSDYDIDFSIQCSSNYKPLLHCTQYRESDLDFLSRLMEREGIYYFLEHLDNKHTLIITDSPVAHRPLPGMSSIPFGGAKDFKEYVYAWHAGGLMQTGHYEVNAYDFEKPTGSLQQGLLSRATRPTVHDKPVYTVQEHLGAYLKADDTEHYAKVGLEICQARNNRITGKTNALKMHAGSLFSLEGYPEEAQNREYLVVDTHFTVSNSEEASSSDGANEEPPFDCEFTVVPCETKYRSERLTPQPRVTGLQTAVVVGPEGEEVYTDEYGRIKVQFHWEQLSPPKSDETLDRCWARVMHSWAGKTWGTFVLPRIGQEVVVEFIEGDPDYPIVIGCVYNAVTMPPFKLPANANVSTNRSNSTKGGGGFNEVRYDDTKGSEQLFVHAEKEHETWVKGNQLAKVLGNRNTIVQGDDLTHVEGDTHLSIKGDLNDDIKGGVSRQVTGDVQVKIDGNYLLQANQTPAQTIYIKGATIVLEAEMGITLKCGGTFIALDPVTVSVMGTPIQLNSGGSAGSGSPPSPKEAKQPDEADDGTKKLK